MPHSPPVAAPTLTRLQALADQCVMCGLCLPHCPTYQRDRIESRGPRGRIALIAAISNSRDWLTEAAAADLDSCLSCLRCQEACPAQVRYGELIDGARQLWRPVSRKTRLWLWLSAHPRWLARLTRLGRHLRRVWPLALLGGLEATQVKRRRPAQVAVESQQESKVDARVLTGCSALSLEPAVLDALLDLSALAGLRLQVIESGCCGALQRHAGLLERGQQLAARHWSAVAAHAPMNDIPNLGWASGCQQQLGETAPAQCQTESVLTWAQRVLLPRLRFAPLELTTELPGLWVPCTLATQAEGQGALQAILQQVLGARWHGLAGLGCCGAAGIRHLTEPQQSAPLTDAVLDEAVVRGCTVILSANPGCLHALRARAVQRRLGLPVLHVFEWMLQRVVVDAQVVAQY